MKSDLKISVIIPVYNSEQYIKKCIESILKQTYTNYEIIIINDGSKDKSKEVIEELKKENSDKIIHIEQKNMGVAKTRNKGIKKSTGDYIAFIDNDDFIDEDYFEKLIEGSDNGKNDIVLCGYRRPDENGRIIKSLEANNSDWTKFLITAPWAKIYKKKFLIDNDLEFLDNNIGEDVYLNLQAYLLTDKLKSIDYIGYNWFFNTKSVSNSSQKDFDKINVNKLLNESINSLIKRNLIKDNYEYLELFFYRYILWFLLFSCKKHKYNEISKKYDELFTWLQKYFPNYKKNKLIGINKPKGDSKSYQLLYLGFMTLHKMKLGKFAIYLYGKN